MATARFLIVVGTDGSAPARAAMRLASMFPWPNASTVHGVVARRTRAAAGRPVYVVQSFDRQFAQIAEAARRVLIRRWPEAGVRVHDASPADAIVDEAKRTRAGAIVVGSRGHGHVGRLLLGSVSRVVVRHAPCPVLVVKGTPRAARRFVIGLDSSENARHAVSFLARLAPPRGNHVTLVTAVETVSRSSPVRVGAAGPNALADYEAHLMSDAERELDAAATALRRAGWRVSGVVTRGAAPAALTAAIRRTRANVLIIGARGVSGLERLLLGSVAETMLDRSPVSVLVAR